MGYLEPDVHIALNGQMLDDDQDVLETVYLPHELEIIKAMQPKKKVI
jgi:hypothetical protein